MPKGARSASGYSGVRAARLEWLWENQPELAEALREDGTTEEYLDRFQQRYSRLVASLLDPQNPQGVCQAAGLSERLKRDDLAEWDRRAQAATSMATEVAYRELVEAPGL